MSEVRATALAVAAVILIAIAFAVGVWVGSSDDESSQTSSNPSTAPSPTSADSVTATPAIPTSTGSITTERVVTTTTFSVTTSDPGADDTAFTAAMNQAEVLAELTSSPSDCPLPLDDPASLPNSPREYRSGVHGGVDFICEESGRTAVAALDGRVVVARDGYVDPDPIDREALLEIAARRGATPAFTLLMLFGNYVTLDHGIIEGVGHVVSVYAHLESAAESLAPGQLVEAGEPLGVIGNSGTSTAADDGDRPRSLHLHWELLIDDEFLGEGLDEAETREVYTTLLAG
ncbi:MAG: M23 family metallopeptidase [Acidimicrobiales bacterium]